MAERCGRPFAWLGLVLAIWTGARWVSGASNAELSARTELRDKKPAAPTSKPWPLVVRQTSLPLFTAANTTAKFRSAPFRHRSNVSTKTGLPPAMDPWQDGGRPSGLLESLPLVSDDSKPLSTGRDTPPTIAVALAGKAGTHPLLRHPAANIYAYSFWRLSTGKGPSLAPGAQYGASQSGVIMTFNPLGPSDSGPALLLRAAATPDWNERELAYGVRWAPDTTWPVTLTAEHRLRSNQPDALAVYLAGGIDETPLFRAWTLSTFGQAGYVSGHNAGGFFDAQARLQHRLWHAKRNNISAGAGAWAGGQKGASRLDIGPTISAAIDTGPATLLIQLDWRLRVAGNAQPKNGLAMTVSTGF